LLIFPHNLKFSNQPHWQYGIEYLPPRYTFPVSEQ
jgi:hypothetical protein